jgi:hypothetical protein
LGGTASPFTTLSSGYQSLLSAAIGPAAGTMTLTIAGLTVGNTYQFEWWNSSSANLNSPGTATAGNSVTLNSIVGSIPGGVGQFAIGTFTADAATEVIGFAGTGASTPVNGFQLRQTAVAAGAAAPLPRGVWAGLIVMAMCAAVAAVKTR